MTGTDVQRLREAWAAFSRGDVDAVADVLDPDVRWYGAGDPDAEGACHSRDQAMAFIRRSVADGVHVELLDLRDAGEHLVAIIQGHNPPEWNEPREPHGEVITVRDGKVTEMVVYPTVDEALAAAGLGPAPRS
jgi:ketosteroid isomerase-like protein